MHGTPLPPVTLLLVIFGVAPLSTRIPGPAFPWTVFPLTVATQVDPVMWIPAACPWCTLLSPMDAVTCAARLDINRGNRATGPLLSRGGEGGRGFWTQNLVYQQWPDQIFPIINFVFSHYGHFGLGRGGGGFGGGVPPPLVFNDSKEALGNPPPQRDVLIHGGGAGGG